MRNLIFPVLFIVFNCACNQHSAKNSDKAEVKTDSLKSTPTAVKKTFQIDTLNTSMARYIAGLKSEGSKKFMELEEQTEWKQYSKTFDSSWTALQKKRITPIKEWANTELTTINATSQDIFYPFSGPDFLNVFTLFPNGKNYIFMGLEPVGSMEDVTLLSGKKLNNYLASVYNSLDDLFSRSYFITGKMVKDMHSNEINGALPILYVFLARTNNQIISVKNIAVNAEGNIVDYNPVTQKNDTLFKKSRGVKIEFLVPNAQDSVRTLYYFSVNLADNKLVSNPGFVKYLNHLGTITTYVKSASYLMHYLTFSVIRNATLTHSKFILQDDSGIAYRFFNKKLWNIKLYGTYTMPITDFKSQFERDLNEAYKKDITIKPIPFTLGYNSKRGGVNLLLATKKQ